MKHAHILLSELINLCTLNWTIKVKIEKNYRKIDLANLQHLFIVPSQTRPKTYVQCKYKWEIMADSRPTEHCFFSECISMNQ